MKEVGTAIMIFTLALSAAYLVTEKLVVKAPLPTPIQRAYISIGIAGVISSFTLYFLG